MSARAFRAFAVFSILLAAAASGKRKDRPVVDGQVVFADGSFPELLVAVEQVCNGAPQPDMFVDSEGRFALDAERSAGCRIHAFLPGYTSQTLTVTGSELGKLILRPRGKDEAALRTTRNSELAKNKIALKTFQQGLDAAAKGKWRAAEDAFEDTKKMFPWASAPFLCLGVVQERKGDLAAAKKSYREAIRVENTWILPYVYAAALEVSRGDWQEALDDSAKVLQTDPRGFPGAYLSNAAANLNSHNVDAAEKSALEGIRLDAEHRFPELEYVLGLALMDKVDRSGALEHLREYLALDPKGPRAAAAQEAISRLQTP